MTDVTLGELRGSAGSVVDRVERGEHLTITRSGKPVAQLRPIARRPVPVDVLIDRRRHLPDGRLLVEQATDEASEPEPEPERDPEPDGETEPAAEGELDGDHDPELDGDHDPELDGDLGAELDGEAIGDEDESAVDGEPATVTEAIETDLAVDPESQSVDGHRDDDEPAQPVIRVQRGLLDTETLLRLAHLSDTSTLPEEPMITSVTLAELSMRPVVVTDPDERALRQAHLQQAEADFDPLPFDESAARCLATVAASLWGNHRNTPARAYDAMIAAIAIANGLSVHTCHPERFTQIHDLEVVAVALPER